LALQIASRHPVAVQGSVKALWEAQSLPRQQAVSNALKYVQVGKAIATNVELGNMSSAEWVLR
jgi:hypothetical protein